MEVRILYCRVCSYHMRATRLAAAIKKDLSIEAKLTPGAPGEFSVYADGKLLAERKSGLVTRIFGFGGWPKEENVVKELRKLSSD